MRGVPEDTSHYWREGTLPLTAPETPAPATDARLERSRRLVLAVSRAWAWVFLVGLIVFFTVSVWVRTDSEVFFLNLRNIQSILNTIVLVLLLGLGQTFVIISGGIDLSVGWGMGLASVGSAESMLQLSDAGLDPVAAIDQAHQLGEKQTETTLRAKTRAVA